MILRSLLSKTAALTLGWVALAGTSHGDPADQAPPAPPAPATASGTPGRAPKAAPAPAKNVEISFATHRTMDVNPEGPEFARTYFMIGTKRIAIGVPKNVRLSTGDGFILLPVDGAFDGEIHISRSPFPTDLDLADNALKYRESAEQGMPKGAIDIDAQSPALDTYPFNGWKSMGFTWTYSSFGRPMVRTVNYINHELGVQILVTTLAVKKDAEKVDKIAKTFMGSWWVMPDAVKQVPVNQAAPPAQ